MTIVNAVAKLVWIVLVRGVGGGERATVMLGIVIDHTMSTPYTQPSSEQTKVGTTANPIAG